MTSSLAALAQHANRDSPTVSLQADAQYIAACLDQHGIFVSGSNADRKYRLVCFLAKQPQYTIEGEMSPGTRQRQEALQSLRKLIFAQGGNGFGNTTDIIKRAMGDAEAMPNPNGATNILQAATQARTEYMIARGLVTPPRYTAWSSPTETLQYRTGRLLHATTTASPQSDSNGSTRRIGRDTELRQQQWADTTASRAMIISALLMLSTSLIVLQFGDSQLVAVANVAAAMVPLIQVIFQGWQR